jgi:hypothetical protein
LSVVIQLILNQSNMRSMVHILPPLVFPALTLCLDQGILEGKYHCTIDLLFDWFGIGCMTTDYFCFYLQNRLIQTSQTGGQWYSDTSLFSIPCLDREQSQGKLNKVFLSLYTTAIIALS